MGTLSGTGLGATLFGSSPPSLTPVVILGAGIRGKTSSSVALVVLPRIDVSCSFTGSPLPPLSIFLYVTLSCLLLGFIIQVSSSLLRFSSLDRLHRLRPLHSLTDPTLFYPLE